MKTQITPEIVNKVISLVEEGWTTKEAIIEIVKVKSTSKFYLNLSATDKVRLRQAKVSQAKGNHFY